LLIDFYSRLGIEVHPMPEVGTSIKDRLRGVEEQVRPTIRASFPYYNS
jgi:hypothetical protein